MTADIDANLKTFLAERAPEARYASFDYCYNHFQEAREAGRIGELPHVEFDNGQVIRMLTPAPPTRSPALMRSR